MQTLVLSTPEYIQNVEFENAVAPQSSPNLPSPMIVSRRWNIRVTAITKQSLIHISTLFGLTLMKL